MKPFQPLFYFTRKDIIDTPYFHLNISTRDIMSRNKLYLEGKKPEQYLGKHDIGKMRTFINQETARRAIFRDKKRGPLYLEKLRAGEIKFNY